VFLAAAVAAAPAQPTPGAVPSDSTPLQISYAGTFDLSNQMVPQGVQHSYTYHVQWSYSWTGTWGELFDGRTLSVQTSFATSQIGGVIHAVWRRTAVDPPVQCTLHIVPDMGDYPDFHASYDAASGKLKILGLATPVNRYSRQVGSKDPMCGGGPEIDVLGAPPGWNPFGAAGVTLGLTGGTQRVDRTWRWHRPYGVGAQREYVSSMRSAVQVELS
jgi:hypothetical protein